MVACQFQGRSKSFQSRESKTEIPTYIQYTASTLQQIKPIHKLYFHNISDSFLKGRIFQDIQPKKRPFPPLSKQMCMMLTIGMQGWSSPSWQGPLCNCSYSQPDGGDIWKVKLSIGTILVSTICHQISYWGDLLRSVPLIMCGHLKMDFFQASTASSFDTNPLSTCPMMIVKYSGQAPRSFPHPFHGMSAHEMSGHDP